MKVAFISGKYRGKSFEEVEANIQKAKQAAIELWRQGYAVITPHLNTAHFDGLCTDDVWLKGDLAIMQRCDVVYMLDNWEQSEGARAELLKAREWDKIVIFQQSTDQLASNSLTTIAKD